MNTTSELAGSNLSVELRIKGESSDRPQSPSACLRFLGEDEIVDLLSRRLGKSESEVRLVLASYPRSSSRCA